MTRARAITVFGLGAFLSLFGTQAVFSVQTPPPTASVQGVVVKFGTNEPVRKAVVEFRGGSRPLSTTTEENGQFVMRGIPPGSYQIVARGDGYAPSEYKQRWLNGPGQPVTLGPATALNDVRIGLFETGVISGRIISNDGNPVANVQVSALRTSYQGLQRVLRTVQETRTNELGEYRLFWLPPGRYYLAAVAPPWSPNTQLVIDGDAPGNQGPNASSVQTRPILGQAAVTNAGIPGTLPPPVFFPSTPDLELAAPVEVAPGGEYRGADLRLIQISTHTVCGYVTIEGEVPPPAAPPRGGNPVRAGVLPPGVLGGLIGGIANPNAAADPCPNQLGGPPLSGRGAARLATVGARAAVSNTNGSTYTAAVDAATGRFGIRNVLPGVYELSTVISGMNGRVSVTVRGGDVQNVRLTLTPGVDVETRVTIEPPATGKPPDLSLVRPYLGDDPPSPRDPFLGQFAANGVSKIAQVTANDYRVYVEPILNSVVAPLRSPPPALLNTYVKSATLGGEDVLNAPMRFRGDRGAVLEIVIGTNPGRVEGRVFDDAKQPLPGALVTILPDPPEARVFRTDMYKTAGVDDTGRFQIQGLPPGNYRIFAWAGIEKDAWMDPYFMRENERFGTSLRVEEGTTRHLDLQAIPPRF